MEGSPLLRWNDVNMRLCKCKLCPPPPPMSLSPQSKYYSPFVLKKLNTIFMVGKMYSRSCAEEEYFWKHNYLNSYTWGRKADEVSIRKHPKCFARLNASSTYTEPEISAANPNADLCILHIASRMQCCTLSSFIRHGGDDPGQPREMRWCA